MTIKNKTIRQLSILGITGAILAGAASQYFWVQPKVEAVALQDTPAPASTTKDWALFGGSVSRNLVNLVEKNLPDTWSNDEGKKKNVKWVVDLGSKAYGGPIIYRGRIYLGTNNDAPRDPNIKDDKGIIMCLDEKTGELLWQSVHDKLPAGRVNDWQD